MLNSMAMFICPALDGKDPGSKKSQISVQDESWYLE